MKRFLAVPLVAAVLTVGAISHRTAQFGISTEELRIRATVLDYVEGIYERDTDRVARALHPDVRRLVRASRGETNTLDRHELIALADGSCTRRLPREGPRRVLVYELREDVAAVRLTTAWGVDLVHLAKANGRWQIVGIVGTVPGSLAPAGDAA